MYNNSSIKTIDIYEETHLPKEGWLQGCFRCRNITSLKINMRKVKRRGRTYKFDVYACKDCRQDFKKDRTKYRTFKIMCHNYISSEYYYLIR